MTEAEWLACEEPRRMIAFVSPRATERKLRLLGGACAARVLPRTSNAHYATLVDLTASVADGAASQTEGSHVERLLHEPPGALTTNADLYIDAGIRFAAGHSVTSRHYGDAFAWLASGAAWAVEPAATVHPDDWSYPREPRWNEAFRAESRWQSDVCRDVFGHPFRPVAFAERWRSSTALALAAMIYAERRFDLLPVLADALEESGCEDADVLRHCREYPIHVRGCWVIDGVLGKS